MATILNPYISFRGEARPALEFYQSVFGGELDLRPFADFDFAKTDNPADDAKIMHGHLRGLHGRNIIAGAIPGSVGNGRWTAVSISLTLSGEDKVLAPGLLGQARRRRDHWPGRGTGPVGLRVWNAE